MKKDRSGTTTRCNNSCSVYSVNIILSMAVALDSFMLIKESEKMEFVRYGSSCSDFPNRKLIKLWLELL